MKKIFSIILSLALLLSMSVTAFAAGDIETLYIDIKNIIPTDKTVDNVYIWERGSEFDFSNELMTHVEGTLYALDVSSYSTLDQFVIKMYYTDETSSAEYGFLRNDTGVNYFTFSGEFDGSTGQQWLGTWTYYGPSTVKSEQAEVTGKYNAGTVSGTVYHVDISWTALNFTYREGGKSWDASDHKYVTTEGGWDDGSGTITVTNHSNSAITATPSYTPANGFDTAGMSFSYSNGANALELATADNGNGGNGTATTGTITVTPTGTLTSAANNSTIGTVTIQISGGTADTTVVSDEATLTTALAAGGNIKLANDITLTSYVCLDDNLDVNIDLNGRTVTVPGIGFYVQNGSLRLSNGTVVGEATNDGGTLTISDCTITSEQAAVTHKHGDTTISDCTINGYVITNSGSTGGVTLSGTFIWGSGTVAEDYKGIWVAGVDVVCDFDPNGNILYGTVTNNGDGTWTVTKAE